MQIQSLRKKAKDCYIIIFDNQKEGCAHAHADEVIVGEYTDIGKLTIFAQRCNGGITTEFETVPASAFKIFKDHTHICPEPNVIEIGQDRLKEKNMAHSIGIKTPDYWDVMETTLAAWEQGVNVPAFPLILKSRKGGYDGNNAWKVNSLAELRSKWEEIKKILCIVESIVPFTFELSVIVGRNSKGKVVCYPAFQNTHKTVSTPKGPATLLDTTTFPGKDITQTINMRAQEIAIKIARFLNLTGILAVELFYVKETDEILFNEIAPRPHNSGHGTRSTHTVSQFDMLASILCDDIVPIPRAISGGIMKNIIGSEVSLYTENRQEHNLLVTLYGKEQRDGRKCGHTDSLFTLPVTAYGNLVFDPQASS